MCKGLEERERQQMGGGGDGEGRRGKEKRNILNPKWLAH